MSRSWLEPGLKLGWCSINAESLINIHRSQGHTRPTFRLPPSQLLNSSTRSTSYLHGEKEFVHHRCGIKKTVIEYIVNIFLYQSCFACCWSQTNSALGYTYNPPPKHTHTYIRVIFCNRKLSTLLLNEWCWWEMTPAFLNTQQSNLNLCANYWPLRSTLLWNNQVTIGLESVTGRPQGKANTGVTAGLFL